MLKIAHLTAGYDGKTILDDISLKVADGSIVALIGPNGSGKTTLIRAISGVLPVTSGEISVDGQMLTTLETQQRARLISVVPQTRTLPPAFTIREVVALGRSPYLNWLGQTSIADSKLIERALQQTDLLELADRNIGELSGGEQQRVLLARALAQDTPILLLDEPTAHLDLQYQVNLMKKVYGLAHPNGKDVTNGFIRRGVLIAVHDLNLLSRFADEVILLVKGKIAASGTPQEVLNSETLSRAYGLPLTIFRDAKTGFTAVLPDPNSFDL
jgi:iron complex transport system ATP-binding protein